MIKQKTISQSELTSECWSVQIWGTEHCKTCEYKDTEECGGVNIIKTGVNKRQIEIPLGDTK